MTSKHRRLWGFTLALAISSGGMAACDVEQTREGALPDVDVEAEAGRLPGYEVRQTREGKLPDVDVDVKAGQLPEYEVETPDIKVERETLEVPYPSVEIELPEEDEDES